ncbi:MAG: cytochrome c3 family protein [Nitrospirae bacterium]|nr:cytochrome c3 family protein [Nitrospirota bacterium]
MTNRNARATWGLGTAARAVVALLAIHVFAGCEGEQGEQGPPGVGAVKSDGLTVVLSASKPANGQFFAAGERIVVTITLTDEKNTALSLDDLSTAGLYMYGPKNVQTIKTAAALLNASTDRDAEGSLHHYVDLKKLASTDLKVNGNVLTYTLRPITSEEAGTYTVGFRSVASANALSQSFELGDVQIGTADVQKEIVGNCADCHKGAMSGRFYLHHADPTSRNPAGSWSIDSDPVRTCKNCHNQEGYAAYCASRTESPCSTANKVPDNIVRRVHGVHMGEELENPLNTDPKNGDFKDYTEVVFPADVRNCTKCHLDDSWKNKPSRLACGACHDHVDFSTGENHGGHEGGQSGGVQTDDKNCATCHPPDSGGLAPISVVHKVSQPMNKIDLSLTAPGNGKYYVAGEKPVVTLVIKDDNGNPIDHTTVSESTFSTAALYVYGPRQGTKPVLTNSAKNGNSKSRASATSSKAASGDPKVWTFAAGDTFKIAVNGGAVQVLDAPVGAQTPTQVVDWLKANLKDVTVSANSSNNINILSNIQGASSIIAIYNSAVTTKMGWKPGPLELKKHGEVYGATPGTTVEPFVIIGNASTAGNDLRPRKDALNYTDPNVTRSAGNITYQLDDVSGLRSGTYMMYSYVLPVADKVPNFKLKTGIGFLTFQVGTETPDKKTATNCTQCHGDTIWHLDEGPIHAEPFDTDYCKACHDYNRSGTGDLFSRVGGNSTSGWAGFGAKPIVARVHGVHRGAYLDHPEWVYAGDPNAFNGIIFPQDIRNCTKCHAETNSWNENPGRLQCMSCHDSDAAIAHGAAMTVDPTPEDPYGGDEKESCKTCHGVGRDFAVSTVHNVWDPYKPPYPREKE